MKKILVPIDGSATSKRAATEALAIAKMYGSEVTFLTVVVVDSDIIYGDLGTIVNADYVNLSNILIKLKMERESSMLDVILQSLDCSGIRTDKQVIIGNAHPQIIEVAETGHFDLIVMGHRGLNPVKRLFLGSVAKRVIEDAPCSVLIVK